MEHKEEIVNMDKPHYLITLKQNIEGGENAAIGDEVAFNTEKNGDIITEGEVV